MKLMAGIILGLVLLQSTVFGQYAEYIRQSAIKIDRQDSLSASLYDSISRYKLIMAGEVHGTKEPAQFVRSLVELLIRNGNVVQVGLEIPSQAMSDFTDTSPDSAIYATPFFKIRHNDNRASRDWVDLIVRLKDIPDVDFFYYDVNAGEIKSIVERDSLMYTKIKKRIQLHPTWKTVTLGGNVHNRLLPYHGEVKTGYENYLFIYPPDSAHKYNGIYFTRKVTASPLVFNLK